MVALLGQAEPLVATETEKAIAASAAETLAVLASAKQDIKVCVADKPEIILPLPARAVEFMHHVLDAMARGTPISLIPHEAELTTQQAADFLNVSRPFLVKLLDEGKIEHRKAGRHRRVRFKDLMEYREASRKARRSALADLAAEEKRLGLK